MTPDLERVLADDYLSGLTLRPLEEVRAMRTECQALENGLSFVRRLVQGRLDIVGSELQNRRQGGDPDGLADLIERLPQILADQSRSPGMGQAPLELEPSTIEELRVQLDRIIETGHLASPDELTEAELAEALDHLAALEEDISGDRRRLHELIDLIRAEITRRYRTGEANVDSILNR